MPAITVDNLSKAYRIGLKEEVPDTLAAAAAGILKAPWRNFRRLSRLNTFGAHPTATNGATAPSASSDSSLLTPHSSLPYEDDLVWALKDVSFDVEEGEVVGIIGRNGAGKSTLLKILSRITEPTSGRAVIRGRVSSLLEVGTGFHPELTGRENIYMNGTILGMTKREIDRKFDEIVDFSGVEKFLDTPIKRYSSGMKVRLAFSVAAHLDPEILIIDEVLAVGDAQFQKKCLGKMQDVAQHGRTVLFVSHNLTAVEILCHRALELNNGSLVSAGDVEHVVLHYQRRAFAELGERAKSTFATALYFKAIELLDEQGHPTSFIPLGAPLNLRITIDPPSPVNSPTIAVSIDSIAGQRILTVRTPLSHEVVGQRNEAIEVKCCIPNLPIAPGQYAIKLGLAEKRQALETLESGLVFTVTDADPFGEGRGFHSGTCIAPSRWVVKALPQFSRT